MTNKTEREAWRTAFDERHEFDVYPDHFMTGLRNEFCAGWHAALKGRSDALYTMDQMRDYAEEFYKSRIEGYQLVPAKLSTETVDKGVDSLTDGRAIDKAMVKRLAVQHGLIPAASGQKLTDEQIVTLWNECRVNGPFTVSATVLAFARALLHASSATASDKEGA